MSHAPSPILTYVSVTAGGQAFGLPIDRVHDVFVVSALTAVPLAPPEIAGLVNLRGRVVTVLDLRARLGLPNPRLPERPIAVGIEADGELYGFVVDGVGDVLRLPAESRDDAPIHLREPWTPFASGVHRLPGEILVVLDVDALIGSEAPAARAA